jgi:osmotically-inducible protein OsmY
MTMRAFSLTMCLALLLAADVAHGAPRSEAALARDLATRMASYPELTTFDSVEASVTADRVVLSGWVTQAFKRDDVERRVRGIDGVREVDNRIVVLPASASDDVLRYRVASAIYGHEAFLHYATLSTPPIRVVVDRGRVTLTGTVRSDAERLLARSLAGGFGALDVIDALRTEASAPGAPGATP